MRTSRFDDLLRDLTIDPDSTERVRHLLAHEESAPQTSLRVVAPACLFNDVVYTLPPPATHSDVLREMAEKRIYGGEAGFLLSNGQFASRRDAALLAMRNGQIKAASGSVSSLQSGDLWE